MTQPTDPPKDNDATFVLRQRINAAGDKGEGRSHEAHLAEFNALRSEITTRMTLQHNLFVLQLTSAGGIFALVLGKPSLATVLFILPLTSYLFAASYTELHHVINDAATYIRKLGEVGGLVIGWEEFYAFSHPSSPSATKVAFPALLIAFPGAGLGTLILCPFLIDRFVPAYWVLEVIGLVLVYMTAVMIAPIALQRRGKKAT